MFIKKALIAKVNETYFRYHKAHIDLFPLDKVPTIESVKNLLWICSSLEHMQGYNLSKGEDSYVELLQDLERTFYDDENFVTPFAKKLQVNRTVFSEKVKRSLPMLGVEREVADILSHLSPNACLVGGCVRDAILGLQPKDFDFATDTPYDTLKNTFENKGFKVKETGKNFLVMNVIKDGEEIEIANFRKDGTYEDGRRPDSVDVGTIFDDAERRDFTVNALYFRLLDESLLDPNGQGIPDIKERVLRFVGNPKDRLEEDALRVFRFYRFLHKGFKAAPKDLRAVRTLFAESYEKTDPMRVQQEIEKLVGV